jgi:hypothetical protein
MDGKRLCAMPALSVAAAVILLLSAATAVRSGLSAPRADGIEARDPTVEALSRAVAYDIFEGPILVQHLYTRQVELQVLIWHSAWGPGGLERPGAKASSNWGIRVAFSDLDNADREVKVTATGVRRAPPRRAAPEEATPGQAVAAAARYLAETGGLRVPTVITLRRTADRYLVLFTRVPPVVGGHSLVELSRDLKHIEVIPGA